MDTVPYYSHDVTLCEREFSSTDALSKLTQSHPPPLTLATAFKMADAGETRRAIRYPFVALTDTSFCAYLP